MTATTMTSNELAAEIARAQATAYVWGRQDAGESGRDTGYSISFGEAYAARKRAYLTEQACFMPNIEAAFTEWRDTGRIA
jgi:hypothetical protein